jgi:hypothetical protein
MRATFSGPGLAPGASICIACSLVNDTICCLLALDNHEVTGLCRPSKTVGYILFPEKKR